MWCFLWLLNLFGKRLVLIMVVCFGIEYIDVGTVPTEMGFFYAYLFAFDCFKIITGWLQLFTA